VATKVWKVIGPPPSERLPIANLRYEFCAVSDLLDFPVHVVVLVRGIAVRNQRYIGRTPDAIGLERQGRTRRFDLSGDTSQFAGEGGHFD
jgi:hypothetical protein